MNEEEKTTSLSIPAAILLAGALIAGAVFLTNRESTPTPATSDTQQQTATVPPVSSQDRILGNPNADIIIVEYSDPECPFCKQFHETMHNIMDEYGKSGRVAWVYRQFPIPSLHPKAPKEAEAIECAAELGGNDGFWAYLDRVFAVTPSNNGLNLALLPQLAADVGLDREAFQACLDSGKHADTISKAYNDALAAGADATPYSFVFFHGDVAGVFRGAYTYSDTKAAIDALLKK